MADLIVLALDVGTSGVKGVACDRRGRISATAQRGYGLRTPAPGWVEQDVDEIAEASIGTLADLVAGGVDPGAVDAVGVTAQMFNLVATDAAGRPLGSMISWLDQRSAGAAAAFAARCPPDDQFDRFGSLITAKDILPRVMWLQAHDGDVWKRAAYLLDCKEAVVARLCGTVVTDRSGASAFRLLDPATGAWDPGRAELAGVPLERLPPVAAATDVAGGLLASVAGATGLRAGTPVVVGTGDVAASQVGSGALDPGAVHLSLGTATYFGITVDRPVTDPARRMGVLGHAAPDHWIIWLEVATGGGALAWLLRALDAPDAARREIDAEVAAAADGMEDLLFAPWLTGERVPLFDDDLRGAFVGLTLRHGRGHLVRAVMEGVAAQLRWAWDYGRAYPVALGAIRAVGGGGIGRLWTAMIADALGRPLEVVGEPQHAGARGAAACALVGVGQAADLASAVGTVAVEWTVEPDPAGRDRAEVRYERLRSLHTAVAPLYGRA